MKTWRSWSPEDDALLEDLWASPVSFQEIVRRLDRTPGAIEQRAKWYLCLGGRSVSHCQTYLTSIEYTREFLVQQDQEFQNAMLRAINAGRERAPVGVCRRPGTRNPVLVRLHDATTLAGGMSSASMLLD